MKSFERCFVLDKYMYIGTFRSAITEISEQNVAGFHRHRQCDVFACFLLCQTYAPSLPVDIFKTKRDDVNGSEPHGQSDTYNGIIPQSHRWKCINIDRPYIVHILRRQCLHNDCAWSWHSRKCFIQIGIADQALFIKIYKETSYSAVISCFALRRRMYILTVKILQSVRGDFAKIIYPVFLQILTESDATGTVHGYGWIFPSLTLKQSKIGMDAVTRPCRESVKSGNIRRVTGIAGSNNASFQIV